MFRQLRQSHARWGFTLVLVLSLAALVGAGPLSAAPRDTTAPTGSFSSPASGATVSGTITVSGTASDNAGVATVEVRVDDGSYRLASGTTSWSLSIDTTGYSDGSHNLKLRVTDTSGNQFWKDDPIKVDNTVAAPAATSLAVGFGSPSSGATVGGTINVTGTASSGSGVSLVEVRVDNGSYRPASGTTSWSISIDTTGYSDGTHNLKARVTDKSGAQAWADLSVVVDNTTAAPAGALAVGFTSPLAGASVSGTISVGGTASSGAGVAQVEVRVDDGSYRLASGTSSWSISIDTTGYSDGAHNLKARVTDKSGAQAWADLPIVVANATSNLTAPVVSFTSPAPGSTVGGTISVKGTAGAPTGVARVEVRVDNGAYQLASGTTSWSISIDTTKYGNGSHDLKARITDLTGNQAWADDVVTVSNGGSTSTSSKIYWGANIEGSSYGYGSPPWDWRGVDTFQSHAGKALSLLALGSNWGSSSNFFPTDAMTTIRNHGSIPFYNWASMTPGGGASESSYQLSDIINGAYDSYITKFAQDAKAWGHPFFLRFDWEMNLAGTYPWVEAVNGNSSGQYVQMWRHVHDIFTKVGANNATWVWCPNAEYNGSLKPLTSLYPGDSYVDWTCIDGYNWGTNPWYPHTWQTFSQVFGPTYSNVTGTVAPSKPVVIGETASSEYGGSKASWITDMLGTQLPKSFTKVKAFLWFNWKDKADWPIETSSSAQSAFASGIKSSYYASNGYASLGGTKVPLP
jgi:beta-mannanase